MTERTAYRLSAIHPLAVVYTVNQFCAMHAISRDTFERLVGREELATFKVGRRRFIAKTEAERWMRLLVHAPAHVSRRGVDRNPAASGGKQKG
jgi:excisionase family DNA binding protein